MSTRWDSPLTEARPPAQPRRIDWICVLVWVGAPILFWAGTIALILNLIGVI